MGHNKLNQGGRPAVILLPGLLGSWGCWQKNLSVLGKAHAVYEMNYADYAAAPKGVTLADLVAQTEAFIQNISTGSVTLIGHSIGGQVALRIAAANRCVRRLVLVASPLSHGGLPFPHRASLQTASVSWIQEIMASMVCDPTVIPAHRIRDISDYYLQGGRQRLRSLLRTVRHLQGVDVSADLRSLTVPLLVVWGRQDRVVPVSVAGRICELVPHARLATFEACGHCPQFEQAAAFNQAIDFFLSESLL